MKRVAGLLLAVGIAACHSSTLPEAGDLQLLVNPQVADDSTLAVRFFNGSNSTVGVGYLECQTIVERLDATTWVPVAGRDGSQECILPLAIVPPGRSYRYRTMAPTAPGTYRFRVTARIDGDQPELPGGGDIQIAVRSRVFDLTAP